MYPINTAVPTNFVLPTSELVGCCGFPTLFRLAAYSDRLLFCCAVVAAYLEGITGATRTIASVLAMAINAMKMTKRIALAAEIERILHLLMLLLATRRDTVTQCYLFVRKRNSEQM